MEKDIGRTSDPQAAPQEPKTPPSPRSRGTRSAVAKMGFAEGAKFLSPAKGGVAATTAKPGGIPFGDQIQESFGHHDVLGIEARVGGSAATDANRLGATAVTEGREVRFASSPDLHTAAHEAAHVIQQSAGRRRDGKVGRATDHLERDADDVADRVVRGEDAEELLDSAIATSAPVPALQRKKKKTVGGKAAKRLTQAKEAIAYTKSVIAFGAGNQYDALKKTNFNTYFRLLVMRESGYWEMDPWVRPLAAAYPEALTAAKADLAKGGNCGEHAQVAFDYLRVKAIGETINLSDVEGLDHAFVLVGNIAADKDNDLVVSDPWPSAATACLWEDHFAHTADRKKINARRTAVADGVNMKAVIARGLRLKPEGQALLEKTLTPKQTDEQLKKGTDSSSGHPWIWRQTGTTAAGRDYDYTSGDGRLR